MVNSYCQKSVNLYITSQKFGNTSSDSMVQLIHPSFKQIIIQIMLDRIGIVIVPSRCGRSGLVRGAECSADHGTDHLSLQSKFNQAHHRYWEEHLSDAHIVYRLYSIAGIEWQSKTVTFISNVCNIINRVQSSFPDHTVFTCTLLWSWF